MYLWPACTYPILASACIFEHPSTALYKQFRCGCEGWCMRMPSLKETLLSPWDIGCRSSLAHAHTQASVHAGTHTRKQRQLVQLNPRNASCCEACIVLHAKCPPCSHRLGSAPGPTPAYIPPGSVTTSRLASLACAVDYAGWHIPNSLFVQCGDCANY